MNQRLSLEEVQEVARLAAQRRSVVHGQGPTADRLADALGLAPGQVESLLAEIRDRKAGLLPPDDAVIFKRLGLGAAALVLLGGAFVAFNLLAGSGPKAPATASGNAPTASFESPVARRFDSPAGVAQIGSRTVATAPDTRMEPGSSNGVLPLGQADVKDYSTDLQNARNRAEEQFARPQEVAISPANVR